jgi:type IV pilus assembly protein PilA
MNQTSKGFTVIELMVVVAIVGILSAIATARFATSRARSMQSEASMNLKAMFAAEKAFSAEKGHYSVLVREIGFSPERNNRYAYWIGNAGSMENRTGTTIASAADDMSISYDVFKYGTTAPFATMNTANTVTAPTGVCNADVAGLNGTEWTGYAQGQIDTDDVLDLWSISTATRGPTTGAPCASPATNNPAGEPLVEVNDLYQ